MQGAQDCASRVWSVFTTLHGWQGVKPVGTRLFLNASRDMICWDPTGMSRFVSVRGHHPSIEVPFRRVDRLHDDDLE